MGREYAPCKLAHVQKPVNHGIQNGVLLNSFRVHWRSQVSSYSSEVGKRRLGANMIDAVQGPNTAIAREVGESCANQLSTE